jgi:hypothetical protein
MSNLNDNPFMDPFADPSVQRNLANSTATTEEFNPFAQQPGGGSAPRAAPVAPASIPPASTTIPMSSDEIFRQQEELRRKEQELNRRQQEFQRQQAQGGSGQRAGQQPHNFPPIPSYVPIEPCFYQDIDVEIPVQFQETVRLVYYVYLIYVVALLTNVFASLFYFIFTSNGSIGVFFLSIIETILFTPCSFLFWFRPLYKAFRDDSSFNFMVFFFVLFFHSIFCLIQALGFSSYACGWLTLFPVFKESVFVALVMLISATAFSVAFAGMVFSLLKVHRFYRGAGFSVDKARKEFTDGVMSDSTVRNATNQAARAAASHAVNEAAAGRF